MVANQETLHNQTQREIMRLYATFPKPRGLCAKSETAQAVENIVATFSCKPLWVQLLLRLALSETHTPNEASRVLRRQQWLNI